MEQYFTDENHGSMSDRAQPPSDMSTDQLGNAPGQDSSAHTTADQNALLKDEGADHSDSISQSYARIKMDRGEGIVRWSPNPSRDEFLTINVNYRIIQLYKAVGKAVPTQFEYEPLSKHIDHQALTAYDWSPIAGGLVAVGTKTGEVHLLRVDDDSNDSVTLPLKLQRACQAVAFNTTGLLAVGLDRVRNGQCLQIWDVNQRLSQWDPAQKGWQSQLPASDPLYTLEPSVAITSVRFFEDQPQTLVVGVKNQSVRVHDLRDPHGAVITFQTRCNNNLAVDHADPNYFASSALDQPGVMVWDRRAASRQTASKMYLDSVDAGEVPWGCALKLNSVIDPRKDAFIRSLRYCRDRRGILGVLSSAGEMQLLYTEKEYLEPTVENDVDGSPELLEVRRSHDLQYPYYNDDFGYSYEDRIVSFDWMTLGSSEFQPRILTRRCNQDLEVMLLPSNSQHLHFDLLDFSSKSKHTRRGSLPKFQNAKEAASVLGSLQGTASRINAIFGSEKVTKPQLTPKPKSSHADTTAEDMAQFLKKQAAELADFLGLNKSAANSDESALVLQRAKQPAEAKSETVQLRNSVTEQQSDPEAIASYFQDFSITPRGQLSSRRQHEESQWSAVMAAGGKDSYSVLNSMMLSRIKDGYLFNCAKNREVIKNDPWLQDVWTWIEGAREATIEDGMVSGNLNLAYMGVFTIWKNDLGASFKARFIDPTAPMPTQLEWSSAMEDINNRAGNVPLGGIKTLKPHHRQLCLAICGWGKSATELDAELKSLEAKGQLTKAAARALFEKMPQRAIDILSRGDRDLLVIAMALDLQKKGAGTLDKERWAEKLKEHSRLREDPYLRAILALITTGDWKVIADEVSLPLRDRVGVAIRNFSDDELDLWLETQMSEAVRTGDIEGIVLVGITDKMMDLLTKYIDVFGDYQTALLIMSFAAPLYVEDFRYWQWRKMYQELHNANKLFILRCKFDVESTKLSRNREGITAIKPPPRQVTLRCVHCDAQLANDLDNTAHGRAEGPSHPTTSSSAVERNPLYPSGVNAGIMCPKCGRHLPRCAVCLMTLGLPRSDKDIGKQATLGNFISFCLKCDHANHADHARDWFAIHNECPVPDCHCKCNVDEIRKRDEDDFRKDLGGNDESRKGKAVSRN